MDPLFSDFTSQMYLHWSVVMARLAGAVLFCGLIGFEREIGNRQAGLRSHILTGLASALYCLIMLHMVNGGAFEGEHIKMDPIRVIEAVTQGVAFLAAGLVVFSGGNVQGLKTGATMWLSAAIGVACALGLWPIAAMVTAMALVIVVVIRIAEKKMGTHRSGSAESADD